MADEHGLVGARAAHQADSGKSFIEGRQQYGLALTLRIRSSLLRHGS
jgi:hypothetical protein